MLKSCPSHVNALIFLTLKCLIVQRIKLITPYAIIVTDVSLYLVEMFRRMWPILLDYRNVREVLQICNN
jgi:hypothetical protein